MSHILTRIGQPWRDRKIILRAEPELKFENYESVQHRSQFPGIKKGDKISSHLKKVFPFHLFYSLWLAVVNCGLLSLLIGKTLFYPILFKKIRTRKILVFWKEI